MVSAGNGIGCCTLLALLMAHPAVTGGGVRQFRQFPFLQCLGGSACASISGGSSSRSQVRQPQPRGAVPIMHSTMMLRGGAGVVPGFDITTGEWSNVDGKSGRILRDGETPQDDEVDDDQAEDEDMGQKLANFEGVVTVDQLMKYADGECEEGNFDTAANLLHVAIEEVEDEFGQDAAQGGEVYLKYATALNSMSKYLSDAQAEKKPGVDGQGGDGDDGEEFPQDAVRVAWEYAQRALKALEKCDGGLMMTRARIAEAHILLGQIAERAGGGGRIGIGEEEAFMLGRKHAAEGERIRRELLTRGVTVGGGEAESAVACVQDNGPLLDPGQL